MTSSLVRDRGKSSQRYLGPWFRLYVPAHATHLVGDIVTDGYQVSFLNSIVRPDPNVDEDDSGDDEDDEENDEREEEEEEEV